MAIIMVKRRGVVPQAAGASPCCAATAEHSGWCEGLGFHLVQVAPAQGLGPCCAAKAEQVFGWCEGSGFRPVDGQWQSPVVRARRPKAGGSK